MVKVRFAPSPTGYLHIGGARTALFNWMYARSQGGKFVLRIEDTDRQRSQKIYEDEILDSMAWLGLAWDELYYQSQRFEIYREHADQLVRDGKAYNEGGAVLLKMNAREVKLYDLIRGEITFDTSNFVALDPQGKPMLDPEGKMVLKDEVLIKADGSPAYSFSCVVDDALMGITCVIRGEDHISNTPKQMLMYEALGFKVPKFAHLPLIMGEEGGRLSKRSGAVAVSDYRRMGFVPEAVVNYLMLLGWSPGGDQEMISLASAEKKFSIKKVNKAAAAFSIDKLKWLNGQYLKQMDSERLVDLLVPFLIGKGYIPENFDRKKIQLSVNLFKGRMETLVDFLDRADFLFLDGVSIDPHEREEHLAENKEEYFQSLAEEFRRTDPFDAASVEKSFRAVVDRRGIKAADLVHPVRLALTGRSVGPGLFETIAVLGKDKTVQRLENVYRK